MISFFKNNKQVFANYIYLLLVQGANFILPLITLPYLVKTLNTEKYGLVMIAQSLCLFFSVFVDFGFNISATRQVSILRDDKKKLSQYFWNVYFIKILLICISFICLLFLILFVKKFNSEPYIYIYSFGLIIGQAIFPSWFFQGIEKMKMITIINLVAKIIFTLSIFYFIKNEKDYTTVPVLNSLGYVISGFFGFLFSLKYLNYIKPSFIEAKSIFKENLSLFTSNLAVSLYTSSNTLILGFFGGDAIAGIYASMEKLVLATKSIYTPFYQALFPFLSRKNNSEIRKFISKIKFPILFIGLTLSIIIFFGAEFILKWIYKTPEITKYYTVFQILGLIAVFSALNMMLVTLFFPAIKQYDTRVKILVFSGLLHLILVVTLTFYYSIYGVAISATLTELLILIISIIIFQRKSYEKKINHNSNSRPRL